MARVREGDIGPRQRFPWDEWFDGRVWVLTKGEDFDTSPERFRNTVFAAASRLGYRVSTRILGDEGVIEVQRRMDAEENPFAGS